MIKKFEAMSQEELLMVANQQKATILALQNNPQIAHCPFCQGTKFVSFLKAQVRQGLIEEWAKDVTEDDVRVLWEKTHPMRPQPELVKQ